MNHIAENWYTYKGYYIHGSCGGIPISIHIKNILNLILEKKIFCWKCKQFASNELELYLKITYPKFPVVYSVWPEDLYKKYREKNELGI